MKVSFYEKKGSYPNAKITCSIDKLKDTHKPPFEWNANLVSTPMVSYLHSIDIGPFFEIFCPHMMKFGERFIECYENDVFQLEF
jgi:hypothetical protein